MTKDQGLPDDDGILQPDFREDFPDAVLGKLLDVESRGLAAKDDPLRGKLDV
jgi:hypothetical protein